MVSGSDVYALRRGQYDQMVKMYSSTLMGNYTECMIIMYIMTPKNVFEIHCPGGYNYWRLELSYR